MCAGRQELQQRKDQTTRVTITNKEQPFLLFPYGRPQFRCSSEWERALASASYREVVARMGPITCVTRP